MVSALTPEISDRSVDRYLQAHFHIWICDPYFVDAHQTFDGARERVKEFADVCPGEYVIDNKETEERFIVSTRDERKN
jgi:hypothetical protein